MVLGRIFAGKIFAGTGSRKKSLLANGTDGTDGTDETDGTDGTDVQNILLGFSAEYVLNVKISPARA